MKKVLSVLAVSAFVLTAGSALAGGPGKMQQAAGCPDECQQQIDDLQSSQAQQNEREAFRHARTGAMPPSASAGWSAP